MANKWKVDYCNGVIVRSTEMAYPLDPNLEYEAERLMSQQLADDLNELEAYREERRWRKIGEEWPEDGQVCQLATKKVIDNSTYVFRVKQNGGKVFVSLESRAYGAYEFYPDSKNKPANAYTHWRPAPTDVPGEEG